jgi:hypothetical protein
MFPLVAGGAEKQQYYGTPHPVPLLSNHTTTTTTTHQHNTNNNNETIIIMIITASGLESHTRCAFRADVKRLSCHETCMPQYLPR